MADQLKRIFYAPIEAVNSRDLSRLDEYVAENCIIHSLPPGMQGVNGLRKLIGVLLKAFPDLKIEIESNTEIAQGDMIAHHTFFYGTNTGSFRGNPPTGKKVCWTVVRTARIQNGKIVELWIDSDRLALLEQLGVIAEKEKEVV